MTSFKHAKASESIDRLIQEASHIERKPERKYENTYEYWSAEMLIGGLDSKLLQDSGFPQDYKPLWQELLGKHAELGKHFKEAANLYWMAADYADRLIGDKDRSETLVKKSREMFDKAFTTKELDILKKRIDTPTKKICAHLLNSFDKIGFMDNREAYKSLSLSGETPIRNEIYARYLEVSGDYRAAAAWYNVAAGEAFNKYNDIERARTLNEKARKLEHFSLSSEMIWPIYYINENILGQDIGRLSEEIGHALIKENKREG